MELKITSVVKILLQKNSFKSILLLKYNFKVFYVLFPVKLLRTYWRNTGNSSFTSDRLNINAIRIKENITFSLTCFVSSLHYMTELSSQASFSVQLNPISKNTALLFPSLLALLQVSSKNRQSDLKTSLNKAVLLQKTKRYSCRSIHWSLYITAIVTSYGT